ncbi:MAG: SufD family Fe-S cluster assembly protein [Acidobacteria bacterium]|nr:SufD family Fe-S cluster assembly protein [Acidobacteriota bacterium]
MTSLADEVRRVASLPLPTTELEHWRYSRINAIDLDAYDVDLGSSLEVIAPKAGVTVTDAFDGHSVGHPPTDAIDQLHDERALTTVIEIAPGAIVTDPIVVIERVPDDGSAVFSRLVIRAGADSEATVHVVRSSADISALIVPVVEIDVADAARFRFLDEQRLGRRVWQLGKQTSRVGRDATFLSGMVALGGDFARLAIESRLEGRGASGELLAVSFGEADQMHDFRTIEDHVAGHTTSNMLFKGAVEGRASSVYTGLIHIGKEAAGSQAFQTNRNIKLSQGAWAESVPNLEIENNDVRCSHASAVGPVDEEQRFYLESRGVPPHIAERLIVLGFFEDVLERLPVPAAMPGVRAELAAKFDRREVAQ